jgi:hypothetical protein
MLRSLPTRATYLSIHAEPPGPYAALYEDCNFQGRSAAINSLGKIDLSELESLGISDDAVSSIKVAPGYRVVIYERSGFSGRHISLRHDMPCLSSLPSPDIVLDDSLSSFEVQQLEMPSSVEGPGE